MDRCSITLISFGIFEKDLLDQVATAIGQEFGCQVNLKEALVDLSVFFDPGRRQYNGNNLLKELELHVQPGSVKTIGLYNVDLFIPILTFIFGQAVLGGNIAIASMYRLNNERYGMPPDKMLLAERFKKEVIHELGHTFGLIHCNSPDCVMRSSTYVEDIDLKGLHLCEVCRLAIINR